MKHTRADRGGHGWWIQEGLNPSKELVREQQSCWVEGRTSDLWRSPKERLAQGYYLGGSGGEAELLILGDWDGHAQPGSDVGRQER